MWTPTSHPSSDLKIVTTNTVTLGEALPVGRPRLSLEGSGDVFGDESVQAGRIAEDLFTVDGARVHQVRVKSEMLSNNFGVLCGVWV
jgi:hypothetical protein